MNALPKNTESIQIGYKVNLKVQAFNPTFAGELRWKSPGWRKQCNIFQLFKKSKRKSLQHHAMLKSLIPHLCPMQHNRPLDCAFGSSGIHLSGVLAKGAYSGDGVNYCAHDLVHFLAQSDSCWMSQWKESGFRFLQNGLPFGPLTVASSVDHHRNRKYSQVHIHFWPFYITMSLSLKAPKRSHFLSGRSKALCLTVPRSHGNYQHHELNSGVLTLSFHFLWVVFLFIFFTLVLLTDTLYVSTIYYLFKLFLLNY